MFLARMEGLNGGVLRQRRVKSSSNTQRTPQHEKWENWRDIGCCQISGGR